MLFSLTLLGQRSLSMLLFICTVPLKRTHFTQLKRADVQMENDQRAQNFNIVIVGPHRGLQNFSPFQSHSLPVSTEHTITSTHCAIFLLIFSL